MAVIDNENKLKELCETLGVSPAVYSCLHARGLTTPGDLAFSIQDSDSLEHFVKAVLRDDAAPEGNALERPDLPDAALKIYMEAGKLRRLYAEAKQISSLTAAPSTALAVPVPPPEPQGPPKLTHEQMKEMKATWKIHYPGELLTDENTPRATLLGNHIFHDPIRAAQALRSLDKDHVKGRRRCYRKPAFGADAPFRASICP